MKNELESYLESLHWQLADEKAEWRYWIWRAGDGFVEEMAEDIAALVKEIRKVEKEMGLE